MILSVLILISCDSSTKPTKESKIYGTLVDESGNPISNAEICIIPDIPSYIRKKIVADDEIDLPQKINAVELQYFIAEKTDGFAELKWATSSELNSDRFEVLRYERKDNEPVIYDKIAEVKAKGSSMSNQNYRVLDSTIKIGKSYDYKLRIIDLDGSSAESDVIHFTNDYIFTYLKHNAPNPFYHETMMGYYLEKSMDYKLTISEKSTGYEYFNLSQFGKVGRQDFIWHPYIDPTDENSTILRPGVYTVSLVTKDTALSEEIILDFKFLETDCKIPLHVIKTDINGNFEIDWKWFPDLTSFNHIAENGNILGVLYNYGKTGEIIARKLHFESGNTKTYLLGRESITIDKSKAMNIKLTAKQVVVQD